GERGSSDRVGEKLHTFVLAARSSRAIAELRAGLEWGGAGEGNHHEDNYGWALYCVRGVDRRQLGLRGSDVGGDRLRDIGGHQHLKLEQPRRDGLDGEL